MEDEEIYIPTEKDFEIQEGDPEKLKMFKGAWYKAWKKNHDKPPFFRVFNEKKLEIKE